MIYDQAPDISDIPLQILKLLDNLTLVKCRVVSYLIQKFIDEEKLNLNRIKVELQNGNKLLFWAAKHGNLQLYELMMEHVEEMVRKW